MTTTSRRWSLKLDRVSFAALVEALDQYVQNGRDAQALLGEENTPAPHLDAAQTMLDQLNTVRASFAEGTPSSGIVAQDIADDRATTVISSAPRPVPVPATEAPTMPYPLPMNAEAVSYRALAQLLHRLASSVDGGALVQDALRAAAEHDLPEIIESEANIPVPVKGG